MLKNWNDPVGAKIKSNVKKCTDTFNSEKSRVIKAIDDVERALRTEIKVTFNRKRIESLSYHL